MSDNYDMHLLVSRLRRFHRELTQEDPCVPSARLNGRRRRRPAAFLIIPSLRQQSQINFTSELLRKLRRLAADIAGVIRYLLQFWQGRDDEPALDFGGEGEDAGVEGAAEGRCDEVGDLRR